MLKNKHIYLIGIAGMGMSSLAFVLNKMGAKVVGSDLQSNDLTLELKKAGVTIYKGHDSSHITENTDVVVYSNAVNESNPEIIKAKELHIPIIARAEMLKEVLSFYRPLAIAGTHGKTTTTTMLSYIFTKAKLDPTVISGGIIDQFKSNAHFGKGDFLIYEACEAFSSIDYMSAEVSCITNIDNDHMEHYHTLENLIQTFLNFINRTPFFGCTILNGDDPHIRSLIPKIKKRFMLYGLGSDNDLIATDIDYQGFYSQFRVIYKNENLGTFTLPLPGEHNIYNALACIGMSLSLGLDVKMIKEGLESFKTPDRRFKLLGTVNGAFIIDDYAHHPTELEVTFNTLKSLKQKGIVKRLIVAFQPHLYTRVEHHHKEFALELAKSDFLLLAPIYKAREKNLNLTDLSIITNDLESLNYKTYQTFDDLDSIKDYVQSILEPKDLFITIGAGDINSVSINLSQNH